MRSFWLSLEIMADKSKRPELLCPAGDKDALLSAIAGGADAVYLGTDLFNARIRANNFTLDSVREAVRLCHAYGVAVYVTLNVAIYERELDTLLQYVASLYASGVDALIVSDLGVMRLISQHFPDFELHGSTQCTVHNLDGVDFLFLRGCKRVVIARELDRDNIEYICKNTKAETEMFIHGAHCMSVSGQCLMSYAMGGRSGNRGECAQPCRLPYKISGKTSYPLSLKDMSLSSHMSTVCDLGVTSLKIEGRMKSADYVYGVASVFRSLVDEKRNADKREKDRLTSLFSRQGFSDGYFNAKIDSTMLGIRSEEDKAQSREIQGGEIKLPKVRINMEGSFILGKKAELTVSDGEKTVTVYGDTVEEAINAPISLDDIKKSLGKLGNTPYELNSITVTKDENIMIRVSSLNALRRSAVDALMETGREEKAASYSTEYKEYEKAVQRTAMFSKPEQIPEDVSYFDRVYVYLDRYKKDCGANGVCLPPVILDSEWDKVEKMLAYAKESGVKYALVTNVGQIERVKKQGFIITADYRFNVFNRPCVDYLLSEGFDSVILSPELTLRQCKDMWGCGVIAYGNIPVMTTHKCIIKDTAGCDKCRVRMTDRTGASFFSEGIFGHRNVIYNSVPVYMADKMDTLGGFFHHFIFSDETKEQCKNIISAYKKGLATEKKIKRLK